MNKKSFIKEKVMIMSRYRDSPSDNVTDRYGPFITVTERFQPLLTVTESNRYLRYINFFIKLELSVQKVLYYDR